MLHSSNHYIYTKFLLWICLVVHLMNPYLELMFIVNFFHCDDFVFPFEVPYEMDLKNCAMCFYISAIPKYMKW